MNLLTLISLCLFLFSFTTASLMKRHSEAILLETTYFAREEAHQNLLVKQRQELYAKLPTVSSQKREPSATTGERSSKPEERPNRACARFNLWPLLETGREGNQPLFDLTANLLDFLYAPLLAKRELKGADFLSHLLKAIQEASRREPLLVLEKISFGDPELQALYYKMLKGKEGKYPPLLDYFTVETAEPHLCLYHASRTLLTFFFGEKAAPAIEEALHRQEGGASQEELWAIALKEGNLFCDATLFAPFKEVKLSRHPKVGKELLFAADGKKRVSLRKELPVQLSSKQPSGGGGG